MKDLLSEYERASEHDRKSYRGVMEARWQEVDKCCFELYEIEDDERMLILGVGRIENRVPGGEEE